MVLLRLAAAARWRACICARTAGCCLGPNRPTLTIGRRRC